MSEMDIKTEVETYKQLQIAYANAAQILSDAKGALNQKMSAYAEEHRVFHHGDKVKVYSRYWNEGEHKLIGEAFVTRAWGALNSTSDGITVWYVLKAIKADGEMANARFQIRQAPDDQTADTFIVSIDSPFESAGADGDEGS